MRYFTGFLIAIGLIVLLFVVILKSGGSSTPPAKQINLNSYASGAAIVQLTIDGPINANQTHQQVQVSVGQTETTFLIMQGYQGTVQKSQTFTNNQDSYSALLQALMVAGFTKGTSTKIADKQGYCPEGERYTFELMESGSDIENYWATSCGGTSTYKGDVVQTLALFQAQVPNYDTLTSGLQF